MPPQVLTGDLLRSRGLAGGDRSHGGRRHVSHVRVVDFHDGGRLARGDALLAALGAAHAVAEVAGQCGHADAGPDDADGLGGAALVPGQLLLRGGECLLHALGDLVVGQLRVLGAEGGFGGGLDGVGSSGHDSLFR